jgi:hypothetical protein
LSLGWWVAKLQVGCGLVASMHFRLGLKDRAGPLQKLWI